MMLLRRRRVGTGSEEPGIFCGIFNPAYYPHLNTTTATESIHRIIQTARRRARGFRNFENLKAVCYRMADRLDL